MSITKVLVAAKTRLAHAETVANRWPACSAAILLGLLFGGYLFTNQYAELYYDSKDYWRLAGLFWRTGQFHLQSFDSILRGYLFPLLLSPLTLAAAHWGVPAIDLVRGVGVVGAALLFGVVGPGLWQAVQPVASPAISVQRRLVFGVLGFVFWRGYFNFPLTDFPALLALLAGLWALVGSRSLATGLLAGLAMAAAANFRPVYVAAMPLAIILCLWPRLPVSRGIHPSGAVAWARSLFFGAGVLLIMLPQLSINTAHFGVRSPLVLTNKPGARTLYRNLVSLGLRFQKYESNVGTDYPEAGVFFTDPQGQALVGNVRFSSLGTYPMYLKTAREHFPALVALVVRHFFNGLDLQYPTPYLQVIYVDTWPLAFLNYTVIIAGFFVLLRWCTARFTRATVPAVLILLAILGPCAASLPTVVECRFLMPLQVLLCAAVAFGPHPGRVWREASGAGRVAGVLVYGAVVVVFFVISSNVQSQLVGRPRLLFSAPASVFH